jgi:hypothetical protein
MVRRQLTLFVPTGIVPWLEPLRHDVDPVQSALIAAHVTLCREDEIAGLNFTTLRERLSQASPLTLVFDAPRRVDGHGLLLPCVAGAPAFQQLRAQALDCNTIRTSDAHITLAHPRNPRAAGNVDERVHALPVPLTVTFPSVALIEQHDARPWETMESVELKGAKR